MMTDSEFNQLAETTLRAIEDAIEALQDEQDIDFETSAGILTLSFANTSKVIINRQPATQEIWVAARAGGFHCQRRQDAWICSSTGETLPALLNRVCSEQAGAPVQLAL